VSPKKLGRYDLLRVLGQGAMGVVYEGRDPNLDRRVAIKTVKVENLSEEAAAEYEARFRTEARSAARLQHPNIVSVYDSDRDGDTAFLVMEYVQGEDLKHHLDKGVRYSLEQSLKMIRDLLSALDYAHKQNIIHRDVKPANLMIEPGGRVKLTDFGVARIQDSGESTRTQGSMVGTLKYMSPEQVQGLSIDSRADLFSVGVVLYQLLTDRRPFDGDNDFSIIQQIIGFHPDAPSTFNARLPTTLDAVVKRALTKDRAARFANAREFAVALQSATRRAGDSTVMPSPDPSRELGKPVHPSRGMGGADSSVPGIVNPYPLPGKTDYVTQELELVYWKDIKESTEPQELRDFLAKFPGGIYESLAQRRLKKLVNGADPSTLTLAVGALGVVADVEATRVRGGEGSRPNTSAQTSPAPLRSLVSGSEVVPTPEFAETRQEESTEPLRPSASADSPLWPTQHDHPDGVDSNAVLDGSQSVSTKRRSRSDRHRRRKSAETNTVEKPTNWLALGLVGLALAGAAALAVSFRKPVTATVADAQILAPTAQTSPAVASPTVAPSTAAPIVPTNTVTVSSTAVEVAASVSVSTVTPTLPRQPASQTGLDIRPATVAASRPARAASGLRVATKLPPGSAPVQTQTLTAIAPPPEAPAEVAIPAPVVAARTVPPTPTAPVSPRAACESRVFIGFQLCMNEQCALPRFQRNPICLERAEYERQRRENRNSNN
jgi:eukaryotic-like serine/threonine-protein kinase